MLAIVKLKDVLEKRMFYIILLHGLFTCFYPNGAKFGVNKTVGWAWDISNWLFLLGMVSCSLPIGYWLLNLLKIRTSFVISSFQIFALSISSILGFIEWNQLDAIFYINLSVMIIFLVNFTISIVRRNKY